MKYGALCCENHLDVKHTKRNSFSLNYSSKMEMLTNIITKWRNEKQLVENCPKPLDELNSLSCDENVMAKRIELIITQLSLV